MGRTRRVESSGAVDVDALTRRVAALEAEVAALRAERELLQRLPVLTVSVDFEGRAAAVGGPWTALLGYAEEELRSMHFIETIHVDDRALVAAEASRLAAPGAARGGLRARLRRKDGGYRWFQIESTTDSARRLHYCVAYDVHELVEAIDLLDRTGTMARVGGWELDLLTREFRLSAEISRIHELESGTSLDVARGIEFYPPEARPTILGVFAAGEFEGKPWDVVVPFVTARGRRIWVRVQGVPVWEEGRVARIQGLFQDVTAQREAEESFISLFDITPIPLMIMDGLEPLRVNRRLVQELGWDPMGAGGAEAMLAQAFPELEYRERILALWAEHVSLADRGIAGPPLEIWVTRGDGMRALYDVRGGVIGGRRVVALVEVGERRSLVAELEAYGATLRRIHEITVDRGLEFAAKVERLLELVVETSEVAFGVVARVDGDVARLEHCYGGGAPSEMSAPLSPTLLAEVVESGAPVVINEGGDRRLGRSPHATRIGAFLGMPVVVDGAIWGVLGLYSRVSGPTFGAREVELGKVIARWVGDELGRQRVVAALAAARDRAEAANRAKSTFLATMSHELRTPMHGVIGTADLLAQEALTSLQRSRVATIAASGRSLMTLLDQILDLAKVEAGKMTVHPQPFAPEEVLGELVALTRPRALDKGLGLTCESEWPAEQLAIGDPLRLRQIVLNFLDNAVKFTRRGEIAVRLTIRREGDVLWTRVTVRDSGEGLDAAAQRALFSPFQQVPRAGEVVRGTGLGLAISRQLARLLGGEVGVESAPGEGATFWVEVPLELGSARPSPDAPTTLARIGAGRRALLVEDDVVNQQVLGAMLEHLGCEVDVAGDGEAGLERAAERDYDVIFMDCRMPRLDGFEATRRLRAAEAARPRRRAPVIALTANAMSDDRHHCAAAGMDGFVGKPATIADLAAALGEIWAEAPSM